MIGVKIRRVGGGISRIYNIKPSASTMTWEYAHSLPPIMVMIILDGCRLLVSISDPVVVAPVTSDSTADLHLLRNSWPASRR